MRLHCCIQCCGAHAPSHSLNQAPAAQARQWPESFRYTNFLSALKPVLSRNQALLHQQGGARGLYSDKRAGNASASSHRAFQGERGRLKLLGLLILAG